MRGGVEAQRVQVIRRDRHPVGETVTPVEVEPNALTWELRQTHMHVNHKSTTTIRTTQVKEVHKHNHEKTIKNIKIHTVLYYQNGSSVSPSQ